MAPIHVWHPAGTPVSSASRLAIGPISGDREIAARLENELFQQRPAARADIAMISPDQLFSLSPVRLASTAALSHDAVALQAARTAQAETLLQGEIISADIPVAEVVVDDKPVNYNQLFFANNRADESEQSILVSWRIIDVQSGKTIGTQNVNMLRSEARAQYPDLSMLEQTGRNILLASVARETWKSLAPAVIEDKVEVAPAIGQPGAISIALGNRRARRGDWRRAELHWERAARWFPFSSAAHHNLALAHAAREDFDAARQSMAAAGGVFAYSLPGESLFWLDQTHRNYVDAHQLPHPSDGFLFEPPAAESTEAEPVEPVEIEDLPWWTAIPFAKPPGWTWKDWLTQPIVF